MENLMQQNDKSLVQKLVLMYQTDNKTEEKVLFKINEEFQNSIIVIGHKKRSVNVATGNVNMKTVRTLVKLPTTSELEVVEYIQELLGTNLPNDTFTNLDTVAQNYDNGITYPLAIEARIATQEFALAIPRYKKGNAQACVDAYVKMLDKYAKFPALTVKLTNTIRYAVRKVDDKLLAKLIEPTTGLFDVNLLTTQVLPAKLDDMCKVIDARLHDGAKKSDKNRGILKRQTAGAPSLQTDKGEFILTTNLFIDDKANFALFPDKLVAHDTKNADFIKFRIESNTPVLVAEEETEDETVDSTTAELEGGDNPEQSAVVKEKKVKVKDKK